MELGCPAIYCTTVMPPALPAIVNPEHTGPYQPPVIRQNIQPKPAGERISSHFLVLHSECLLFIRHYLGERNTNTNWKTVNACIEMPTTAVQNLQID